MFSPTGGSDSAANKTPSFLDAVSRRNATIANLTGMIRSSRLAAELQSAARLPGEVAQAAAAGLVTGGKAVVNGFATAIRSVATLGLDTDQLELIGVTKEDRANGYDTAVKISTASGQVLIALRTGGLASALSKGGTVAQAASGALLAFDASGNAVGVVQGVYDATQNGVSISNGAQVAGGLLGLGANVAAVKGTKASASPKEIAPSNPTSSGRQLPFGDSERANAVNNTLDRVASGGQLPYKKDGTIFRNDRGQLPQGSYREYTVETPGAPHRGTRRIIVEQNTGKTYYTDDHYKSFIQIDPRKK